MIKKLIKPNTQTISFLVPESYVGKEIEIIAFITEKQSNDSFSEKDEVPCFVSESILAKDWLNDEENKAWENL